MPPKAEVKTEGLTELSAVVAALRQEMSYMRKLVAAQDQHLKKMHGNIELLLFDMKDSIDFRQEQCTRNEKWRQACIVVSKDTMF